MASRRRREGPGSAFSRTVQVHQTLGPGSLTAVTTRCEWSAVRIYDRNAPGQNHGLLLGTLGWSVDRDVLDLDLRGTRGVEAIDPVVDHRAQQQQDLPDEL